MSMYYFQCPYCWEKISMFLDYSQKNQNYIEDCEVCCHPIQLIFRISQDEVLDFKALNIEQ